LALQITEIGEHLPDRLVSFFAALPQRLLHDLPESVWNFERNWRGLFL